MFNQIGPGFYYSPLLYTYDTNPTPLALPPVNYMDLMALQLQHLRQEQTALIYRINTCQEEKEQIQAENKELKEAASSKEPKEKRRYRRRRTWLEKNYRCNAKGCKGKYSSKIALNLHKRKKHPKKAVQ